MAQAPTPTTPTTPPPAPAQQASGDEEEEGVEFKQGDIIESSKFKWTVIKMLGEGGFGAVYLVKRKNGIKAAMKVEIKTDKRKDSKLKMEIAVLKDITASKHFTKIIDRGRKEDTKDHKAYFFIVMQLVGKSLHDLKNTRPEKVFSFATALGVAHQCLESVEEMHKHGYVHRDLKPQNYACGLTSEKHVIYILDFGIARKYINSKNEVKTPRVIVGFKGTVRFASVACHRGQEMGPKDDCESWFYMFIDFTSSKGLPWKKIHDKKEVLPVKLESWHGRTENPLYGDIKHVNEIAKILGYLAQLAYQDKVDYSFIYKLLHEAGNSAQVNIEAPYDWETPSAGTAEKTNAEPKTGK